MQLTQSLALSLPALALALPTLVPRLTVLETTTDILLFTDTIAIFEAARNSQSPSTLIWTSDGCSDSPDNPLGFNFKPSCHRHDFGYRNYKAQARFTDDAKNKIDKNFKDDMDDECNKEKLLERVACKALAEVYYEAVQEFGEKKVDQVLEKGA